MSPKRRRAVLMLARELSLTSDVWRMFFKRRSDALKRRDAFVNAQRAPTTHAGRGTQSAFDEAHVAASAIPIWPPSSVLAVNCN